MLLSSQNVYLLHIQEFKAREKTDPSIKYTTREETSIMYHDRGAGGYQAANQTLQLTCTEACRSFVLRTLLIASWNQDRRLMSRSTDQATIYLLYRSMRIILGSWKKWARSDGGRTLDHVDTADRMKFNNAVTTDQHVLLLGGRSSGICRLVSYVHV